MNSRIFFSFPFRGENRRLFRFCSSSSFVVLVVLSSEISKTTLNLLVLAAISISAALLRARLSSLSPPYRRRRGRCLFDSSSTLFPFVVGVFALRDINSFSNRLGLAAVTHFVTLTMMRWFWRKFNKRGRLSLLRVITFYAREMRKSEESAFERKQTVE